MGNEPRWMTRLVEETEGPMPALPWARGARRADMIARRSEASAHPAQPVAPAEPHPELQPRQVRRAAR